MRIIRLKRRGFVAPFRAAIGRRDFQRPTLPDRQRQMDQHPPRIHRHLRQPPRVRPQRRHAAAQKRLQPAILLLKMLGAQKHALLPHDPVGPAHCPLKTPSHICFFRYGPIVAVNPFIRKVSACAPLDATGAVTRHVDWLIF